MDSSDKFSACRLCLREGLSLMDIFDESNEQRYRIKEAIEDLLHFKVNKRLNLPWVVCSLCCAKLDDFRNFKIRSINSNERFIMKLNHQEEQFEESPSPNMFDIVDMKTELPEVLDEASPQVARVSPIHPEQEEEMMSDRGSMEMDSMPCSSERGGIGPHLTVEGYAADFWRATETALDITIPKYLKNILKMNGCDNGLSMSDFVAASFIPVLERFVREDMHYVIPTDCLKEDYYGIFERCPERFRIMWGHTNILIKMAEHWKETRKLSKMLQKKNERPFPDETRLNPQYLETQGKNLDHDMDITAIQAKTASPNDTINDEEAPKSLPESKICPHSLGVQTNPYSERTCIKLDESSGVGSEKASDEIGGSGLSYWKREKDHLVEVIKESLSDRVADYGKDVKLAVNDLHGSDVITKFRLLADVQCFLCTISIRTYRVCSEYNMSKWMVSNYVRHVVDQHCVSSKRNKKKCVSPSDTSPSNAFDFSLQDNQHAIHTRENILGGSVLEEYCEEDSHPRVSSLCDETPSKKKRSIPDIQGGNCES